MKEKTVYVNQWQGNDKIHIIGASSKATKLRLIAEAKKRYKKKK